MSGGRRFRNRAAEAVLGAFSALIVFIGLGGLAAGDPTGTLFCVVGVVSFVRALRSSDVTVNDTAVRTRSMVRTRHLPLSDLRGVDVAVGPTGFVGYRREFLVFHRVDGDALRFTELNAKVPSSNQGSVVRDAAEFINSHLGH